MKKLTLVFFAISFIIFLFCTFARAYKLMNFAYFIMVIDYFVLLIMDRDDRKK